MIEDRVNLGEHFILSEVGKPYSVGICLPSVVIMGIQSLAAIDMNGSDGLASIKDICSSLSIEFSGRFCYWPILGNYDRNAQKAPIIDRSDICDLFLIIQIRYNKQIWIFYRPNHGLFDPRKSLMIAFTVTTVSFPRVYNTVAGQTRTAITAAQNSKNSSSPGNFTSPMMLSVFMQMPNQKMPIAQ